ncbi:MAG: response regulator, partial [Candidatus Zixiibacteriota bacterium]
AEDDRVNQILIRKLLRKRGLSVTIVGDGRQAVQAFRASSHDVIFLDMEMPVMNGLEAAQAIRRIEARTGRQTPIIALTAASSEEDRQRCLQAGMDDILCKPIQVTELFRQIDRALGFAVEAHSTQPQTE